MSGTHFALPAQSRHAELSFCFEELALGWVIIGQLLEADGEKGRERQSTEVVTHNRSVLYLGLGVKLRVDDPSGTRAFLKDAGFFEGLMFFCGQTFANAPGCG